MGNQQSVANTINTTINKSLTDVFINNTNTCGQNNSVTLAQGWSGITATGGCQLNWSNINQTVKQSPNMACTQSATDQASLLSDFETKLNQAAAAELSGLGGAINSQAVSESTNELINVIGTNIDMSNVATCVQNNMATATQNWNNITIDCTGCGQTDTCSQNWSDITQKVIQDAVGKCIQSNTTIVNAINKASNDIAQETESTATGIDIFSGLNTFFMIGGIILAIIIIGIIIFFITRGRKGTK